MKKEYLIGLGFLAIVAFLYLDKKRKQKEQSEAENTLTDETVVTNEVELTEAVPSGMVSVEDFI